MSVEDIAVIGAGSYGTCLAMLFGKAGHRVSFWARKDDVARQIAATRESPYLPGHSLPSKPCVACGRPFTWRKKWERDWDNVRYCSDKCRASPKRRAGAD